MAVELPYAARLAAHLVESRRAGLPWERAQALAAAAVQPDGDTFERECWRAVSRYTWRVMREGYLRVGAPGVAIVGALAERDV